MLGFLFVVEIATLSRSGMLGLGCGFLVLLIPYRRHFVTARFLVPLGLVLAGLFVVVARRSAFFEQVLTSRLSTEGRGSSTHFLVYDFIPDVLAQHPLFGLGLNTFSVYYEFQTGKTNFGPHSFYVASFVETGLVGTLVFAAFLVYLFRRAGATTAHRSRARGDRRPARRPRVAARMGPHRRDRRLDGVERLLPHHVLLLLLRHRPARDRRSGGVRAAPRRDVKVLVLTTSYPRDADDVAGTFVRDGVDALRAAGLEVRVVSPASFRHYGIAYGNGIVNNLRAAPWKAFALPLFLLSFAAAARRAARDADVVHAHWLPSALPALATRKPLVLQLWGSDVALARRARPLARWLVRRAGVVVCASTALSPTTRARSVRAPYASSRRASGFPSPSADPRSHPHALYVGRLSEEKGVRELARAADGLPLVVVGDGPLRSLLPQAVGFVPPRDLGPYYERASVVVVPSRREGYGMAAREAMAYGRPVVATEVGGLVDAVEDGVTGLLVAPGNVAGLRDATERLLGDAGLRAQLGAAGRARAEAMSLAATAEAVRAAYADAVSPRGSGQASAAPAGRRER